MLQQQYHLATTITNTNNNIHTHTHAYMYVCIQWEQAASQAQVQITVELSRCAFIMCSQCVCVCGSVYTLVCVCGHEFSCQSHAAHMFAPNLLFYTHTLYTFHCQAMLFTFLNVSDRHILNNKYLLITIIIPRVLQKLTLHSDCINLSKMIYFRILIKL